MKYSFVLPAYKAGFLKEAIDSILSQTYKDFELIIVNDASPEDLDSIIRSYHDERIQYYINECNIGGKDLVAQWEHSISYAKGEYLVLASDDDIYDSSYLFKMDELVSQYPDVDVFRPRIKIIDAENNTTRIYGYLKEYMSQLEFCYHWMMGFIGSGIPYYMVKREALLNIGGYINFPSAWGSDDATLLLLSRNGVACSQEILFSFRMSGENISSVKNGPKLLQKKLYARLDFYKWLDDFIAHLKTMTSEEEAYLICIKNHLSAFYRIYVHGQLASSTPLALLSNIKIIIKLKCISLKDYLVVLFRSLRSLLLPN